MTDDRSTFFTLLLLISFASVNAVLFTPALPQISHYFAISNRVAQHTITWFLVGYTFGQLIYGSLSSRFGRKQALYMGIGLQIISSFICIMSGYLHAYWLLITGRFLLALGSGVGLKMTYAYVNECYEAREAAAKTAYLALSFAVTPGISVALGGFISAHTGWMGCFYAGALYGAYLLYRCTRLPASNKELNRDAFKPSILMRDYKEQFSNIRLLLGALMMGFCTCFPYVFAALAPFVVINLMGFSASQYGMANLLPPIGLLVGGIVSSKLARKISLITTIRCGSVIACTGVLVMFTSILFKTSPIYAIFLPMIMIYIGASLIMANSSSIAMQGVVNKAHGSAVMSFVNMGTTTLAVLSLSLFPIKELLLPVIFGFISVSLFLLSYKWLNHNEMKI